MNTEQITRLKQLKDAIELRLNGDRNIEVLYKNENAWREFYGSDDAFVSWIDDAPKFRPRPQSETRPWSKPEDVPLNCWMQMIGTESCFIVTEIRKREIVIGSHNPAVRDWTSIQSEGWQYSTDRQTWHACTCPK